MSDLTWDALPAIPETCAGIPYKPVGLHLFGVGEGACLEARAVVRELNGKFYSGAKHWFEDGSSNVMFEGKPCQSLADAISRAWGLANGYLDSVASCDTH